MRRVSSGYTIVEVLIFLAISVALMGSVMELIKGRQAQVDFDQKARDSQSKIQSWISESAAGFTGADPTQTSCTLSGGRPLLASTGSPSASPDCVFLGKAIQFTDINNGGGQPNMIYAYSVFGARLNGGVLPTDIKSSNPDPAVGQGGSPNLTQSLDLGPVEVKSVVSSAVGSAYTTSHLVGFFNSLNTEANTTDNGQNDINAYQFRFDGSQPAPGGTALVQCLEMSSASPCNVGLNPDALNSLKVCLSDGRRTAQITINSSAGVGATVKLDYVNC